MDVAYTDNDFLKLVVEYLELLYRQGIISDLGDIDTEVVIRITQELRDYFIALHSNDTDESGM